MHAAYIERGDADPVAGKGQRLREAGQQQEQADRLGLVVDDSEEGVVVVDVSRGSAAAEAGIRRGDIIVSVNRKKVANSADYQRIILQSGRGGNVIILARRGDASIYFALRNK